MLRSVVSLILALAGVICLRAAAVAAVDLHDGETYRVYYDEGLRYERHDDKLALRLQLRSQFRYTFAESVERSDRPGDPDLIEDQDDLDIVRARVKLGGHVWKPWLSFYWEHDLRDGRLLDLRAMIQPWEEIGVRVGQYKVLYNRERVESSGRQTMVDRSVVNKAFTVDRQAGGSAVGHLFAGSGLDSKYAVGLFVGAGREGDPDDSDRPMFVGRYQWNFLGRDLDYSSTDIDRRDQPAGSLAFGAVSYRGAATRFSTSGGGQLSGFEVGDSGRYEVTQAMIEGAYQHRGFAFNSEVHWKGIDDRDVGRYTNLVGFYVQAGYFFHESFEIVPEPLEFAARVARVESESPGRDESEIGVGANWFFFGHRCKLTTDVTWLDYNDDSGSEDGWMWRLQWDVSL